GAVTGNGSNSLSISGTLSEVNAALATLSDTDTAAGTDTITFNAVDVFGNTALQQTTAITVNGDPVVAPPGATTIGVGQAAAIAGASLSESGDTSGETFTVTVADTDGALSVSGAGGGAVTGNGSNSLLINGTLSQVNAALATLSDTDTTAGTDTITFNAVDVFGNTALQQTTAITVNGDPVVAPPGAATIGVGQAAAIAGASLSESGDTSDETFTVTVADTNGVLSVAAGAASVSGNGSNSLSISGTLSELNAALATLSDTDTTAGTDTITFNAVDVFGNTALQETTAITVNGDPVIAPPGATTIGVGQAAA